MSRGSHDNEAAALDADRLLDLEMAARELKRQLDHAHTATVMHWHDERARHLGTARSLAREIAQALGEPQREA